MRADGAFFVRYTEHSKGYVLEQEHVDGLNMEISVDVYFFENFPSRRRSLIRELVH